MKLFVLLALCAFGAAALSDGKDVSLDSPEDRKTPVDIEILIQQLTNYIRYIIKNGALNSNIPPLDPLELDHYHLTIPPGIFNLDLKLKNVLMLGLGTFVVHRSYFLLSDLSFDIDVSFPKLHISTEYYDLTGDILESLPLYGEGKAVFDIEELSVQGKIFLKRSENGKSIIIDRIENAAFQLPIFKSVLDGAIGGGVMDAIVDAIIEEGIMDYVRRFEDDILKIGSKILVDIANPLLNQLDTWKYIE